VIGYPVCYTNLLYLPGALGKYRLHDNKNHLSKIFVLWRTFLTLRGCGMTVSRRETWMESKANKKGGEENLALFG
jgi:hypothetical protein